MEDILQKLAETSWHDYEWRKLVADILREPESLSQTVANYMRSWKPGTRSARLDGSHETATHYKWLIYRNPAPRFTVWLHDYKPDAIRGPGYAQVPHDHRYDLCSMVLVGGYDSVLYDVDPEIAPVNTRIFRAGDILSMRHNEVHSLTNIREGTQSLFVEGPKRKNFSTSYPIDSAAKNWVDFDGRWVSILGRLNSAGELFASAT